MQSMGLLRNKGRSEDDREEKMKEPEGVNEVGGTKRRGEGGRGGTKRRGEGGRGGGGGVERRRRKR